MERWPGHHHPMQAGAKRGVCAVFKEHRKSHEVDAHGLNLLRQNPTRVLNRVRVNDQLVVAHTRRLRVLSRQ